MKKNKVLCLIAILLIINSFELNNKLNMTHYINLGNTKLQDHNTNSITKGTFSIQYQTHNPIYIDGNDDFSSQAIAEGWTGNGSKVNPYIIQGLKITEEDDYLIRIRNVNVYFVITECLLIGALKYGIYFRSVVNAQITNNTIRNNQYGIYFSISSNNTITNNTISDNSLDGIFLCEHSGSNNIVGNTISNNTEHGINLFYTSDDNIIRNNNLTNCGFGLYGNTIEDCLQREVAGNLVNGKPLILWQNINGGTIPSAAGQIILINTTDVTVTGQNISKASIGLIILCSHILNIYNNTFSNNSKYGMLQHHSNNVTVNNNFVSNNEVNGIRLYSSSNNTIANNTIIGNSLTGIALSYKSNSNSIINNTIKDNETGISLYTSKDNIIRNNNLTNCGFSLIGNTIE
ncbi:MAG: right-handed parallel beta-helix repeat-containing protein, partial [Candidatus Hodarchaeales archaeon]